MPLPLAFQLGNYPVVLGAILASGIGGTFHYGFSISAMNAPSEFIKDMMNETCETRYNVTSAQCPISVLWPITLSIFSLGGMMGSMVVGSLVSHVGRKKTMLLNSLVAIAGAVLMVLSRPAKSFEMIIVGRVLYGINAGISLTAHTLYVTECAPMRLREVAGVTAATFTCIGRFCGQLLGIRELLGNADYWPWLLGFNGLTALFQLITLPFLPESPNFLLLDRGDRPACEKALKKLWGDGDHSRVMDKMQEEKAALEAVRSHSVLELVQDRRVRWQLVTLIIMFISLQLSGVVAVYFYSYEVFRSANLDESMFSYAALGMGGCEMFASFLCLLYFVGTDAKSLLAGGYIFMCLSLGLLITTRSLCPFIPWMSYCSMACIYFFVGSCAVGPGAVTGPLPGQIFTHTFKSAAFTLGYLLSWSTLFIVGMIFSYLVEATGYFCFVIFLVTCLICFVFVEWKLPKIKNRTVLDITADFQMRRIETPAASVENGPDENDVQDTRF